MSRLLKYDIPGTDWRCDLERVESGGWEPIFAPRQEPPLRVVVEIGFCRGEFLMELAAAEPGTAFVGIECSFKRVLKMARRLALTPLENVRLVHAYADRVLLRLFAEASVDCFWINFPDPWPKRQQERRRLIRPPFIHSLATRLRAGGRLHVATDADAYAQQIDRVLGAEPRLANEFAPEPWLCEPPRSQPTLSRPLLSTVPLCPVPFSPVPGRSPTSYELEWRAQGRPLHFFQYRRRAPSLRPGDR